MARRLTNSHREKVRRFSFVAKMRRDEPLRQADRQELETAAARIGGPAGWYSMAGSFGDEAGCTLVRFATAVEAGWMQRWIDESGIASRPPTGRWDGPQLSFGR